MYKQVDTKAAMDKMNKGIVDTEDKQIRYPKNFVIKMLKQFPTPRKLDNGPEIPIKI